MFNKLFGTMKFKDAIERALIDALNTTRSFSLSNGELSFCNEKDEVVLKAAK